MSQSFLLLHSQPKRISNRLEQLMFSKNVFHVIVFLGVFDESQINQYTPLKITMLNIKQNKKCLFKTLNLAITEFSKVTSMHVLSIR